MSNVKYEIKFSVSGNHTVSVSGDDKAALKEGIAWAKAVCDKLAASKQPATPSQESLTGEPQQVQLCAIHHSPMKWMVTGRGSFWSCHRKLDDGSFCPYRPPKEAQGFAVS